MKCYLGRLAILCAILATHSVFAQEIDLKFYRKHLGVANFSRVNTISVGLSLDWQDQPSPTFYYSFKSDVDLEIVSPARPLDCKIINSAGILSASFNSIGMDLKGSACQSYVEELRTGTIVMDLISNINGEKRTIIIDDN